MRSRVGIVLALALAGASACSGSVTEIVLELDSDLSVPLQLDALSVSVARPGEDVQTARADLTADGGSLPRTVTLVHRGGSLGPVEVTADGLRSGVSVVDRDLALMFEKGERLRLRVFLSGRCQGIAPCGVDATCADGGCRSVAVDPCEYEGRMCPESDAGTPADAPVDMGPPDAPAVDACVAEELCNEQDDDCDGLTDEGFDLSSDPENCSQCGRACPTSVQNGTGSTCESGVCVLQCGASFGDCNLDTTDGCETNIEMTAAHCGGCGNFCPTAGSFHAMDSVCSGGRCLLSCEADWGDCDSDVSNGCETHTTVDRDHCGGCNIPCLSPLRCMAGVCQ